VTAFLISDKKPSNYVASVNISLLGPQCYNCSTSSTACKVTYKWTIVYQTQDYLNRVHTDRCMINDVDGIPLLKLKANY